VQIATRYELKTKSTQWTNKNYVFARSIARTGASKLSRNEKKRGLCYGMNVNSTCHMKATFEGTPFTHNKISNLHKTKHICCNGEKLKLYLTYVSLFWESFTVHESECTINIS